MQHYTLSLFRKDDSRFELRIQDAEQKALIMSALIAQKEIDPLLTLAENHYASYAPDLEKQGRTLFNWIDQHSGGWLRQVRQTPQAMALNIGVTEGGLRHLPWELLHDGVNFLCADPIHWFTPLRLVSKRTQDWKPQSRQLGILFMASSPENVKPVLDFEAEETAILQATRHRPLDLQVEESGSLAGLEKRLTDMAEAPDVLHLTGHADVDGHNPVFLLEDEIGNLEPTSPLDLARSLTESGAMPRLIFLSGCRTGQSEIPRDMLSFSEQMVQAGVEVVLGWALPVGDQAATTAAAALYEKLATGFSVPEAVAFAREQLLEAGSTYWHILRCFTDASTQKPLVGRGRLRIRVHDTRQEFLDAGGIVPVCPRTGFIGRRRLLQRCLRVLRSWSGDENYAEGIQLHGLGGLGKSSTAARLVDRLRASHEPVVCYGGLDDTVLLSALAKRFPEASTFLNEAELSLEQRLRCLFEPEANSTAGNKSILLVFDDFEQNIPLEVRQKGRTDFSPESLAVLHAVLRAIHDGQSDMRVIVTSRFKVPVPEPCRLHNETPESLRDADLNKKLALLEVFQSQVAKPTDLQVRAVELAAGSPRLLEWLDKVFK